MDMNKEKDINSQELINMMKMSCFDKLSTRRRKGELTPDDAYEIFKQYDDSISTAVTAVSNMITIEWNLRQE